MGDKEKKFKDKDEKKRKDCGCGSNNCDCGDHCDCTPEDNCGCDCCNSHNHCGCENENCHCEDNCNCNHDSNCGCDCHDDCDCHEHECNCNHEPTAEDYKKVFEQLKQALLEGEKQLIKAKNDAMDNQRIAVSYKKDLERYKERNANIQEEAQNNAVENIASKLIPILDQFETALNATQSTAERKGFEMIYAGLKRSVSDLGIVEIDALNQPFNTAYHNAVSKVTVTEKQKDGLVTAVYQKGYKLKTNKIIRYAMVEIGEYTK